MKPTEEQAAAYQMAFDHFNQTLFNGDLPFAYLNFSRHAGSKGFFSPERWGKSDGKEEVLHEISLNPDLLLCPPVDYYSTLVHEMVHHWQQCFGSPSRNGYHNLEWARKMIEIGLTPTDTGEPGGNFTGQRMTHLIEPDGRFMRAFKKLPKEALLPWVSGSPEGNDKPRKPKIRKIKLLCPSCETKIWAESDDIQATCDDCGEQFLNKDDYQDWKRENHDD